MNEIQQVDWTKVAEIKILEYEIKYKEDSKDTESKPFYNIGLILNEILENIANYFVKDEKNNKYYAIDSINKNGEYYEIILKNCKYNFTPDIINVETNNEHPSSKNLNEGDKEQTHILIYGNKLLLEKRRNGTPLGILQKYFNEALQKVKINLDAQIYKIVFAQIFDENFLDTLKIVKRIKSSKFKFKSNLLNSDFFNFSNDTGVEDTYLLEIKAKKRNEFNKINFIKKIESLLSEEKAIDKISVDICDENNISRIINTEEFAKFSKIYVSKKETGELLSTDMFEKMKGLI